MGTIHLQLPSEGGLSSEERKSLERACIIGGPDKMPTPTVIHVGEDELTTQRHVDESGNLLIPWTIEGYGLLSTSSATLMEREKAYSLLVELARGKVNQVRCQTEDWRMGGLQVSPLLQQEVREASKAFGKTVTRESLREAEVAAVEALRLGFESGEKVVRSYMEQVLQIRHQRSTRLETEMGCRVYPDDNGVPEILAGDAEPYLSTFNSISIPFSWHMIEAEEATYDWDAHEALLAHALDSGWRVSGGPLIDFSASQMPNWLWLWEGDLNTLVSVMCKYVETVVRRYQGRIKRWCVCAGSNSANVLRLEGEALLGLTYRLVDAARQVDSSLELTVGIGQPWGEHLLEPGHTTTPSPFYFVETLLRAGMSHLSALDLEIVMGTSPRGSYCRDLLDMSRIIDLYALLGLPLHVTLGYPAATTTDTSGDPDSEVGLGHWEGGFTPEVQATWARDCAKLALAKPFVQRVQWAHLSDEQAHLFPNVGLVDSQGRPRPALQELRDLRQEHLR